MNESIQDHVSGSETIADENERLKLLDMERCKEIQRLHAIIDQSDKDWGRLRAENDRLLADVNSLNNLLRSVGWGQGEIDSSATIAEENDRLRAELERRAAQCATIGEEAGEQAKRIAKLETALDKKTNELNAIREAQRELWQACKDRGIDMNDKWLSEAALETIAGLRSELEVAMAKNGRLDAKHLKEKNHRIYYQTIVYDVCNALDRIAGNPRHERIVCGTADHPSTAVKDRMRQVADRLAAATATVEKLRAMVESAYREGLDYNSAPFDEPSAAAANAAWQQSDAKAALAALDAIDGEGKA